MVFNNSNMRFTPTYFVNTIHAMKCLVYSFIEVNVKARTLEWIGLLRKTKLWGVNSETYKK